MSTKPHISLWRHTKPLILASGSRTREVLLRNSGLDPVVIRPLVDERELEAKMEHSTAENIAIVLATAKAQSVAESKFGHIVVGADQILSFNNKVLHKSENLNELRDHLSRIQGKMHVLHTVVALSYQSQIKIIADRAVMTMRTLSNVEIDNYIDLAESSDILSSVGGYQLESLGINLFENVEGHYSTILGLPMLPLLAALRDMNALAF